MNRLLITWPLAILVCAAAVAGCGSSRAVGLAGGKDARAILIAVDRSKSMYFNDPKGLSPLTLQAMIALAPPGSSFGVMAYDQSIREVTPLQQLSSRTDRERVAEASRDLPLEGKTDFQVAFTKGEQLFRSHSAPDGSSLVLLTDGQHNIVDKEGAILDTVENFKKNKWKIDALAFTFKRHIPFLENIAQEAGGEAYMVNNPGKLLDVALKVCARPDEMFTFSGSYSAVTVLPGTIHMLLAALKNSPEAGFVSMKPTEGELESKPLTRESPSVYTYPRKLGADAPFDIMNILAPRHGIWEIEMEGLGNPSCVHVLCDLPVEMTFAQGALKEIYDGDDPLNVAIRISSGNAELYEWIKENGSVEVVAEPKGLGNVAKMSLELTGTEVEGEPSLLFAGETRLFAGGSELVEFTLIARLAINCEADSKWVGSTRASVKITPGGSSLAATPETLDFGTHWADEEPLNQEFEISGVYPGVVAVKMPELPGCLSCEPTEFDVTDELKQKVRLTLDPSKVSEFGPRQLELLLANTILANNSKGVNLPVTVNWGVYKIEIEGKPGTAVEQHEVEVTAAPGKEISHVVPMSVTPPLKFAYEPLTLMSETEEKLTFYAAQNNEGNTVITFSVPTETLDGTYRGELKMLPEVTDLAPRTLNVSLTVVGRPQVSVEPAQIELAANKSGWVEQVITISVDHYEDVGFGAGLNDIACESTQMLISGRFDAELVPLDDWDGKKLKPGQEYKANLRYYISTDLRPGSYKGEAEISVVYRGDRKAALKLPVSITLIR